MARRTHRTIIVLAFALAAGACSSSASDETPVPTSTSPPTTAAPATTAPPPTTGPTTTTSTSTTTTQPPPTTTTTTTTTPPLPAVLIEGSLPADLQHVLTDVYRYKADAAYPTDAIPEDLLAQVEGIDVPFVQTRASSFVETEIREGERIGVVHVGNDLFFAADTGDGWQIVATAFEGAPVWIGTDPIFLLVLGSDARPGQNQQRLRADSIHVLALSPSADGGTFVGFPRDSEIQPGLIRRANEEVGLPRSDLPGRSIKFTSIMSRRGPEIMLGVAKELTGLPISGYVVTGFEGFQGLVEDIGGVLVDLDRRISTGNSRPNFPAGEQLLDAARTLLLARLRKTISGGDLGRTVNQGMIILSAMSMLQDRDIDVLGDLVSILLEHTWTDLSTPDLLRFAVAGLLMDPGNIDNIVAPGYLARIRSASFVVLRMDELGEIMDDIRPDAILEGNG